MKHLRVKETFAEKIFALALISLSHIGIADAQLQSSWPVCSTAFIQPIVTATPQTIFVNEYISNNTTIVLNSGASITVNNAPTLLVTQFVQTLYQTGTVQTQTVRTINSQDGTFSRTTFGQSPKETYISDTVVVAGSTSAPQTTNTPIECVAIKVDI